MKKILATLVIFVCTILLCTSFTKVHADGAYSGGSGTSVDPYQIATLEDWTQLNTDTCAHTNEGKYYILTADISGVDFMIGVNGTGQLQYFRSSIDGNGHTITCNISYDSPNAALIAQIDPQCYVKNLVIKGSITCNTTNPYNVHAGSIAAYLYGEIQNCINYATIKGISTNYRYESYIGGIVGFKDTSARIYNCVNFGKIIVDSSNAGEDYYVGGIVGHASDAANLGTISNCAVYNDFDILNVAVDGIGAFVGNSTLGTFDNWYVANAKYTTTNNATAITAENVLQAAETSTSLASKMNAYIEKWKDLSTGSWKLHEVVGGEYRLHLHQFSEEFTSDETGHWHAGICHTSEISGFEEHTYSNFVCTKCGYENIVEKQADSKNRLDNLFGEYESEEVVAKVAAAKTAIEAKTTILSIDNEYDAEVAAIFSLITEEEKAAQAAQILLNTQAAAKSALESLFSGITDTEVVAKIAAAKTAIDSKTTPADIDAEYNNAVKEIYALLTAKEVAEVEEELEAAEEEKEQALAEKDEQIIIKEKSSAKGSLDHQFGEFEDQEVKDAIAEAKATIDSKTTSDSITEAYNQAIDAINELIKSKEPAPKKGNGGKVFLIILVIIETLIIAGLIVWFVVLKKSFQDFIGLFKKENKVEEKAE